MIIPPILNIVEIVNNRSKIEEEVEGLYNDDKSISSIFEEQPFIKKKKFVSKYEELDTEINKMLSDLNFWVINKIPSENTVQWLDIIYNFFDLLHNCYDYKHYFRLKAQYWKDEITDMNPWMGRVCKSYYKDKHKDHSLVAGGDADHWIGQIPLEDKLLRSEGNIKNNKILDYLYQKHKEQILKEAGKSSYGVLTIADIRKEIINGSIFPFPLKRCYKIFYENNTWIVVFLLQAFIKTPSK